MAERETVRHSELLTPEEIALLEGGGVEQAARAVVSEAVVRLVGALGLTDSAGAEIVGVFRRLPLGAATEVLGSVVDVSEKVNQLTEAISRRGAAVLRAVERNDPLTLSDPLLSTPEETMTAAVQEVAAPEVTSLPVAKMQPVITPEREVTADEVQDDQERPIELNGRSLRYIQTIFGDVASLDLREKHKSAIAYTIDQLRGASRSNHRLVDITPQLLLMFYGLKDKEIGAQEHIRKTGTAVYGNAPSVVRRVKEQPGYSFEHARAVLAQNLGLANTQPVLHVEAMTKEEERAANDELASEEVAVIKGAPVELDDTPQLGKLRGEVRRILKQSGHNHLIDLNAPYLSQLIDDMFADEATYKEDYVTFLQRGVRSVYDTDFARVIHSMPQKIASHLGQTAAVHHQPPTSQAASRPHAIASVSPLIMPQRRPQPVPIIRETAVEESTAPSESETSPLMRAALEPATMPDEEWFTEARRLLNDTCQAMGWSETEASLLWNMVHFDKKHLYKQRTPATEEVRHKLFTLMEEGDDRLNSSRDIKASLTMLLNTAFGVKNLDDIQQSLRRKNPSITEGAAQRYVVAGIHELTREV